MGRFFQAKPIELSQNNIYQPPFELMMVANEYDNNLIKQDVQREEDILNKSVFDFKEGVDDENFKRINADIKAKSDLVAQKFQENPESKEAKQMLYELNREMQTLYKPGGAIDNIRKTYNNDLAYKKKLAESGLDPIDQKRNYEGYLNQFKQNNPNGSVGTYYTPGDIVENANDLAFVEEKFKLLKPDAINSAIDSLRKNPMYITKTTDELKGIFKQQFYKDTIEANPDVKAKIDKMITSGFYQDYDMQRNSDGSYNYDKGGFKTKADFIKGLNYSEHTVKSDLQADAVQMADLEYRRKKADEKETDNFISTISQGHGDSWQNSEIARRNLQKIVDDTNRTLVGTNSKKGLRIKDATQLQRILANTIAANKITVNGKTKIKNIALHNSITTKLNNLNNAIAHEQNAMVGSYAPLAQLPEFKNDTKNKIRMLMADHAVTMAQNGTTYTYRQSPIQVVDSDGNPEVRHITENYQEIRPDTMIGKKITLPNGDVVTIQDVRIRDKSFSPMFRNLKNLNDNEAGATLQYFYRPGDVATAEMMSFDRTAIMQMNQLGVLTTSK